MRLCNLDCDRPLQIFNNSSVSSRNGEQVNESLKLSVSSMVFAGDKTAIGFELGFNALVLT
jgi:hypothetical protein